MGRDGLSTRYKKYSIEGQKLKWGDVTAKVEG